MAKSLRALKKSGSDIEPQRRHLIAIKKELDAVEKQLEIAKDFFKKKTGQSL